jgi:hypothetical protein
VLCWQPAEVHAAVQIEDGQWNEESQEASVKQSSNCSCFTTCSGMLHVRQHAAAACCLQRCLQQRRMSLNSFASIVKRYRHISD